MPGISVIVPVYQAEKFLPACVESVTNQTFSDWELLLVDDGCTDRSPAVCDRFAAADSRIRALHQPKNAGVSEARNRGLREARGEFIAFLDADDAFEPQTLEILWNLRQRAGADSAACAHRNLFPNGNTSVELVLPAGVYDHEASWRESSIPCWGTVCHSPSSTASSGGISSLLRSSGKPGSPLRAPI